MTAPRRGSQWPARACPCRHRHRPALPGHRPCRALGSRDVRADYIVRAGDLAEPLLGADGLPSAATLACSACTTDFEARHGELRRAEPAGHRPMVSGTVLADR